MTSAKFVCIRFYNDMSAKYSIRDEAGMQSWKEYNEKARPGCALFINGEHVPTTGYIANNEMRMTAALEFCKANQAKYEAMSAFTIGWEPASIGEPARNRYPDDRDIYFYNEGDKAGRGLRSLFDLDKYRKVVE